MNCGVYLIENLVNGKVYVGGSIQLQKRHYDHFYHLEYGRHKNPHLQNAYTLYGRHAFRFEVLEFCSPDELLEREDWWIELLKSQDRGRGYNLRSAERPTMAEETRAKLRAANIGKSLSDEHRAKLSAARRGKVQSKETREKRSAALKGHSISVEAREKIGAAHRGKVMSEAAKAKMSASRQGKKHSDETKAKMSASHKVLPGVPRSEEARAKMSAAKKGKPWTPAQRKAHEQRKKQETI